MAAGVVVVARCGVVLPAAGLLCTFCWLWFVDTLWVCRVPVFTL